VDVLVVCTGNVCRSPLVAALLTRGLDPGLVVVSAGTRAAVGAPACRRLHPEPLPGAAGHRARPLTADDVRSAALVLGAARAHRSAAVALMPSVQRRAFTLAQAARAAGLLAQDGDLPPSGVGGGRDRLARCVEQLDARRGLGPRPERPADDDLPDPHDPGAVRGTHAAVAARIGRDVAVLLRVLAPG
jgi:protein-tyrosine phosphatase